MTNKTEQQLEKLKEMNEQLARLNQQQDLLQEDILAERRDHSLLSEDALNPKMEMAEIELEKLSRKLGKAKAHIKMRKREITQWKENFDRLEQMDKSQELTQLQAEIAWRAQDIAAKEAEIAALYVAKTTQTGVLEALKIKTLIAEKGYHKKDMSEDPRLKALLKERQELQEAIAMLDE